MHLCPDHPRRYSPLKFCVRGGVCEVVIYFKFQENRSRGLGTVEGRKAPSAWLTMAYTTVQSMIIIKTAKIKCYKLQA